MLDSRNDNSLTNYVAEVINVLTVEGLPFSSQNGRLREKKLLLIYQQQDESSIMAECDGWMTGHDDEELI